MQISTRQRKFHFAGQQNLPFSLPLSLCECVYVRVVYHVLCKLGFTYIHSPLFLLTSDRERQYRTHIHAESSSYHSVDLQVRTNISPENLIFLSFFSLLSSIFSYHIHRSRTFYGKKYIKLCYIICSGNRECVCFFPAVGVVNVCVQNA